MGLELVPEKRLQKMVFVSVLCCVKWHLLHFTCLSKPSEPPPLLLLCYDHIAALGDKKPFHQLQNFSIT